MGIEIINKKRKKIQVCETLEIELIPRDLIKHPISQEEVEFIINKPTLRVTSNIDEVQHLLEKNEDLIIYDLFASTKEQFGLNLKESALYSILKIMATENVLTYKCLVIMDFKSSFKKVHLNEFGQVETLKKVPFRKFEIVTRNKVSNKQKIYNVENIDITHAFYMLLDKLQNQEIISFKTLEE